MAVSLPFRKGCFDPKLVQGQAMDVSLEKGPIPYGAITFETSLWPSQ